MNLLNDSISKSEFLEYAKLRKKLDSFAPKEFQKILSINEERAELKKQKQRELYRKNMQDPDFRKNKAEIARFNREKKAKNVNASANVNVSKNVSANVSENVSENVNVSENAMSESENVSESENATSESESEIDCVYASENVNNANVNKKPKFYFRNGFSF